MKTPSSKFLQSCTRPLGLAFFLGVLWAFPLAAPTVAKEAVESGSLQLTPLRTLKNDFIINRLAWHPDNKTLAVGQNLNKKIAIWSIETGQVIRVLDKETGGVGALAYSPDGKYLAVGRNFTAHVKYHVNLYDARGGELVRSFVPPRATKDTTNNDIHALAFSPDSLRLATHGYGGGAVGVVYDLSHGNVVATLQPSTRVTDAIESLSWSPNGHWVAVGRVSGRLELWNADSWKLEKQRDINRQAIYGLAFSPDSRRLALGSYKRTAEQTAEAEKEYSRLPENFRRSHPAPTAAPHDLFLLDADSLTITRSFSSNHTGSAIRELTFTPDGKFLVSGANAKSVAVHEVSSGTETVFLKDFKLLAHPALGRDGKYLAVGAGEEIRLYEFTR